MLRERSEILSRKRVRMETSLAIVEDGALVASRGGDMVVPWWSFTKTVIAAAALCMVRDGRLALDTPLDRRPFTLRQLLGHRAGVAEYGAISEYHAAVARDEEPWPVATLLERAEADRLLYPPGDGWLYSNIGYLHVRELIERTRGEDLDTALRALVLAPLGISGPRIAMRRADLAEVAMGGRSYHPGWVYHGLMVGRLADAALLLERLLTGELLPGELQDAMRRAHTIAADIEQGRWRTVRYGLGLMTGIARDGDAVIGHTGGGPGSAIAVYRVMAAPPFAAAAFRFGEEAAPVEDAAFRARTILGGVTPAAPPPTSPPRPISGSRS
jgi:CubicO group peptidase (beta-lactamase class C family)